ncbi:MAG: YceI family protein [Bacteroidota bacterium]
MKTILLNVSLIACLFIPLQAYNQQINTDESKVSFRIGNLGVNTVKGTFTGMSGDVNFDEQNLGQSSFSVCIDASSIDTGVTRRDEDLRDEKYFHVAEYPEICFVSDNISRSDDGYRTRGELTLKGVTRSITIPFEKEGNILRGSFSLNRFDYNVGEGVGTFLIAETAEVTIECVLIP